MPSTTTPQRLAPLLAYLDNLSERADLPGLHAALTATPIERATLTDCVHFGDQCYARNLVCADEHYQVLVICWRSGQRSPIHNHARSVCGLCVLDGKATETVFQRTPSGLYHPTESRTLTAGQVLVSQDDDVHQVSNLEAPGCDLVTLHVYSPPLLRMDTFSLCDRTVGEYRPAVTEHIHGSGI